MPVLEPQITFRDVPHSDAIETAIRRRLAELDDLSDRITACRVMVERPHRHHSQGGLFHIRIDLTVPGHEIIVNRAPSEHGAHVDALVAVRDAFDAARRQLQDWIRRQRGQVKIHEERPSGRVARLFEDYGFIETLDGREVYFHRNSVLDGGMERLHVGDVVHFVEEPGAEGPQASTVALVPSE